MRQAKAFKKNNSVPVFIISSIVADSWFQYTRCYPLSTWSDNIIKPIGWWTTTFLIPLPDKKELIGTLVCLTWRSPRRTYICLMSIVFSEFLQAVTGGLSWVGLQVLFQVPIEQNYFWMVTIATSLIMLLEYLFPWRKEQRFFRKDWGVDLCYLYANLFVFTVVLEAVYALGAVVFPEEWGFDSWFSWDGNCLSLSSKIFCNGGCIDCCTQMNGCGSFIRFIIPSKRWG